MQKSSSERPLPLELLDHLDFRPFLELPFLAPHQEIFAEILACKDLFQPHRKSLVPMGWSSLAIRALGGDMAKTDHHSTYGANEAQDLDFAWTEAAQKFPCLIHFLNQFFYIEDAHRIRIMALDPGAKIELHSDAPNESCLVATNIAITNPDGCSFYSDVYCSTHQLPLKTKVPFAPGKAMLMNIAKPHFVENLSSEVRYHVIVHADLKTSGKELLELAQKQNDFYYHGDLLDQLLQKKIFREENLETDGFLERWFQIGWTNSLFQQEIRLAWSRNWDVEPAPTQYLQDLYERIEAANSLVPQLNFLTPAIPKIEKKNLHQHLESLAADAQVLILLPSGLLFGDRKKAAPALLFAGNEFLKTGRLWQTEAGVQFVNVNLWRQVGRPQMTETWSLNAENETDDLPSSYPAANPLKSLLKFSKKLDFRANPRILWESVKNFETSFADAKQAYTRKIFFKNTETFGGFQPVPKVRTFITVAAGVKPIHLLHEFLKWGEFLQRTVVVDQSVLALDWFQGLAKSESKNQFVDVYCAHPELSVHSCADLKQWVFQSLEAIDLTAAIKALKKAEFHRLDFVTSPEFLFPFFEGESCYFWHSNAFTTEVALSHWTLEEIRRRYLNLGLKVARARGQEVFLAKEADFMVVAPSPSQTPESLSPSIYFAGLGSMELRANLYTQIDSSFSTFAPKGCSKFDPYAHAAL